MKKLFFVLLGFLALGFLGNTRAENIQFVKVSSFYTGSTTGLYYENPSWGIKLGDKIILNDAYNVIDTNGDYDDEGNYIYTTKVKKNIAICNYDANNEEYCDYQNIKVWKTDTEYTSDSYPSKAILQYNGSKLSDFAIQNVSGYNNSDVYIVYNAYPNSYNSGGYFTKDVKFVDVLGDKFAISLDTGGYLDYNNGLVKSNNTLYQLDTRSYLYVNNKGNGYGLTPFASGAAATLLDNNTGYIINKDVTIDPNFVNYFLVAKDTTSFNSINLKFDNSDKKWINGNKEYSLTTSDLSNIYQKSKAKINLNTQIIGYIGSTDQFMKSMSLLVSSNYDDEDASIKSEKATYTDKNGKTWAIIKMTSEGYEYDDESGSGKTNDGVYYVAYRIDGKNIITTSMYGEVMSGDNHYSDFIDGVSRLSIKKNVEFSMPKDLGINIVNPEKHNYFVSVSNYGDYTSYNAIDTSSTGSYVYIYKNQYSPAKSVIANDISNYKYIINSNNSPVYIKSNKDEYGTNFNIVLPIKDKDGADASVSISAYTNDKNSTNNLKNLINKALYTNVKITKTKKNAKDFENTLDKYFANIKTSTSQNAVSVSAAYYD